MVANVKPFVDRARKFLESEEPSDLFHTALELRFAIEEIAYDKLKLRLKYTAPQDIDKWQPDRVIQQLQDLVDPKINLDTNWSFKPEQGPGSDTNPTFMGTSKGIGFKDIRKRWQKLGSYLHRPNPKRKQGLA